ncbi:3-oxoacyl-[acyl-carrier-protein] synthase III C-terminal domain-containing protein [Nocardia blacklockiae]|uniref:3-oxoacyl-[acyl-carrier-protein] synthase III C-terminal domain-containing protein n=1 Tax=Nocardia blacklockiae TaxID=480036 RepID=UPI0018948C0B|nr:3-oxoacyl-[acyl-carrier-protein] synthase III C-terminal domain-containing protein [Nocardia blacklockiae]MBF6175018.1 3-oxoacyl-ACP synthase [Nocardia blacklockiae]
MSAYITATGHFLPGPPVPNEEIEDYIGRAGLASADLRDMILTNSGIKTRHYAIDTEQRTVYSNTRMAAEAVRRAVDRAGLADGEVQLLAAATTIPDLLGPGHASMIHGELGYAPMEVMTAHGICSSGMMALKDAYLQVAIGEKNTAAVVASEFASRGFKSSRYAEMRSVVENGSLPMETAFLRYMLSDGAGAVVVRDEPAPQGVSLRIDWISLTSYANTEQACMFFGSNSNECAKTWGDYATATEAVRDGAMAPRQKLSLLPHLVDVGIAEYERLLGTDRFDPAEVTWFPVHYSSERMKELLLGEFKRRGVRAGKEENWYSNLTRVGNVGSASIYLILDEMMTEGMISPGDTLLCMVPESGRFIVSFMHLTAVTADR